MRMWSPSMALQLSMSVWRKPNLPKRGEVSTSVSVRSRLGRSRREPLAESRTAASSNACTRTQGEEGTGQKGRTVTA